MDKEQVEQQYKEAKDLISKVPTFKRFSAKADYTAVVCEEIPSPTMDDLIYIGKRLDYLWQNYNDLWNKLYDHINNGHIPKIEGASQMRGVLKALGMDGDYDVQKQVVYASDGTPDSIVLKLKK